MKEEYSSGGREFMYVIVWAAILYIACGVMMSLFGDYAFIGGIISLIIFCIFGYIVLTHYTARFTYSLKDGRLRINRSIGKRNKEMEFACADITRTQYGEKPIGFAKPIYGMRISVKNAAKSMYIEFNASDGEKHSVVIEPSEKLRKRIEKERKKADG